MARWFQALLAIIAVFFAVWAVFRLSSWAIGDARRRNKPALFVWIAVVAFFPWGLIAWLLFRPAALLYPDMSRTGGTSRAGH